MAYYGGLEGILTGPTKSTDHPSTQASAPAKANLPVESCVSVSIYIYTPRHIHTYVYRHI